MKQELVCVCPICFETVCKCRKRAKRKFLRQITKTENKTRRNRTKTVWVNPERKAPCTDVKPDTVLYKLPKGYSIWQNPFKELCVIEHCQCLAVVEHVEELEMEHVAVISVRRLCAIHAVHFIRSTGSEAEATHTRRCDMYQADIKKQLKTY